MWFLLFAEQTTKATFEYLLKNETNWQLTFLYSNFCSTTHHILKSPKNIQYNTPGAFAAHLCANTHFLTPTFFLNTHFSQNRSKSIPVSTIRSLSWYRHLRAGCCRVLVGYRLLFSSYPFSLLGTLGGGGFATACPSSRNVLWRWDDLGKIVI